MRAPRLRHVLLLALPLLASGALAGYWIHSSGARTLVRGVQAANPLAFAGAIALTVTWLLIRFVRWQFLLRRAGVRVPIRGSFSAYLGSLPGTATPAYVGETVRALFLKRRFDVPARLTLMVLVSSRLHDVAALALLALAAGLVTHAGAGPALLWAGVLLLMLALGAGLARTARGLGIADGAIRHLHAPETVLPAVGLSVAAWGAAALLLPVAARGFAVSLPLVEGVRAFATSTLLGAASLAPAGMGVTGTFEILSLEHIRLTPALAVLIVSLMRLASTGFALALGTVFLVWEFARRPGRAPEAAAHFDRIAQQYHAQWSEHIWDLLLERKLGMLTAALPAPAPAAGLGLDLGCGLGLQLRELRRRGYAVVGLDPAVGLLAAGRRGGDVAPVVAGSALELPFADGTLDFVYAVGVLHHLPSPEAQRSACAEIARVLKPGGVLLVHESNPRNPLFRFYMGYVFPILKQIDEGTEWWIDPRRWQGGRPGREPPLVGAALRLEEVQYFTFLPDFTPRPLLPAALALERFLERGPTRPYSVHYLAVLRRAGAAAAAAPQGQRGQRAQPSGMDGPARRAHRPGPAQPPAVAAQPDVRA